MKKILYIIISVLIVTAAIGMVWFKKMEDSMDQIKLQYENEVVSSVARPLDFSPVNEALSLQSQEEKNRVRGLVLGKDITDVQSLVKEQKVTVEEILLLYAERIKTYDGYYHSVIQLNPLALEEARALDRRIQSGKHVGELAGIIVLVKDNVSVLNMNTTAGAYALKDLTTSRDAFVVKQLKNKDAIILGKNNLSEWSNFMSMPSSNGFSVLGGQTKNAYGQYDVGGSSSGPAVASAMNFASVTIGSETAGSLIYPAGQNSVVAIKPTLGLLSRDLVIPISEAQDTLGVMGRTVTDIYQVFKASVAVDESDRKHDVAAEFLKQPMPDTLDKSYLSGKRIGILDSQSDANQQLVKELKLLGATVVPVEMNQGDFDIDMMTVLNYGIVNDLAAYLNNESVHTTFKSLAEIHEFNANEVDIRMPYGDKLHEMALNEAVSTAVVETIVEKNIMVAKDAIDQVMDKYQVEMLASFSNELSGVYAPAGYPALTVPAGYKESGEPYGVTFVAKELEDVKLFQAGYAYEQGTRHRRPTAPTN